MRVRLFLIFFIAVVVTMKAQDYKEYKLIPPLDVPMKLSGTFGELRSNHFHSGIDLKTGELEGLKVYAIADGYVSRIKIQSGGYGKALYITHTNGLVSVFAHLSNYNSLIGKYVETTQYARQSYELDLYPEPGQFPVTQGDIIAFTGNTGRSGGPHLHFEIRTEADQKPVNPLLFNYSVKDQTQPIINLVKIYPNRSDATVDGRYTAGEFYTVRNGGVYALKGRDTIPVSGNIYFGINTFDPFNGGMNKNGVYSIRVFAGDVEIYGHRLETFSFGETRYINSLIDYGEYRERSRRVQKSFIQPNNRLSIYTRENKSGLLVEEGKKYKVRYEVSDIAGNVATLVFWVKGEARQGDITKKEKAVAGKTMDFSIHKKNIFKTGTVRLEVPGRALYENVRFGYTTESAPAGSYSAVHQLHTETVPLHSWCKLEVKPENLPAALRDKALLVKLEKDGDHSPGGGQYQDGFIITNIREFGDYCVMVDTIPPTISPVNIKQHKSLLAQNTIEVKIKDELSGIGTYNAYLNGEWALMEYDAKNDLLIYRFDHLLIDGENTFRLVVSDERKNIAAYEVVLTY